MKPWEMMQRFGAVSAVGGGGDAVAASILSKLTSWWEMSEASGTRYDSKGTNHLSVIGTVATATGARGGGDVAAAFAGAGGLSAENNTSLQVPAGGGFHCIFGWVYLTANSGTQAFFSKWLDTTEAAARIEIQGSSSAGNYNAVNGGTTFRVVTSTEVFAAGGFHFYTMWRDNADGKLRLQVDNGTVYVSASASDPTANAAKLIFGQRLSGAEKLSGRLQRWGWIKGAILTADERAYLYNSGAGRTYAELAAAGA